MKIEKTISAEKLMLVDELNNLLSSYQVFYQNLRGFHWNVKGPGFFELHNKFELMYDQANAYIDLLAERVLTLGGVPIRTFSEYLSYSSIDENNQAETALDTVMVTLAGIEAVLELERKLLNQAGELDDEGTVTMISDDIAVLEKEAWMLRAYLG
jgi:starvation-inducible DNA-binding protein